MPTRRSTAVLALIAAAAVLPACTKNASTGRNAPLFGPDRQGQIAMGIEAQPEVTKEFGGPISDPQIQAYVTDIGMRLSRVTEADNPTLPWEFTALNSDVINAFALPGGKVFITKGLMRKLTNEAQLAGVLGHEAGHVTAEHTAERMSDQLKTNILVQAATTAVGAATDSTAINQAAGTAFNYGGQVVVLKYSRDQESEADSLGMRYMSRLKYNPTAQRQVMEVLKAASAGGREAEIFATHPYPETRIERINKELQSKYKNVVNDPAYRYDEETYRSRVLSRLALAPSPVEGNELIVAGLGHPSTWCGLCAAASHK